MLIQDFKYFVNAFMLENLFYFINLKNCINCYKCRQDPTHPCYTVSYRFHERTDSLYYLNQAIFDVIDVLTLDLYLKDIHKAVHNSLLKLHYQDWEISTINTTSNIEDTIRIEESVLWCFDQLWLSHPIGVVKLPKAPITAKSPSAASGCFELNASVAPIPTQQPDSNATSTTGGTSVAGTIGSTLNDMLSPDDEVNSFH